MPITIAMKGNQELALRFERFPAHVYARLERRMEELIDKLEARVQAATPFRTGRLRREITARVYADNPERVAGYVSVVDKSYLGYARGAHNEYAKAATLEYGSNVRPGEMRQRLSSLFGRNQKRLAGRIAGRGRIREYAYLRGPLEAMRPEIEAALGQELVAAVGEEPISI